MSYIPTSGVAERWTRAQVDAYMRKWSAQGRSKKAIRNYLIAEDVCESPDFKGQCATRLDAAWSAATSKAKGLDWEAAARAALAVGFPGVRGAPPLAPSAATGLPGWVLPVAIGGGALVLVLAVL